MQKSKRNTKTVENLMHLNRNHNLFLVMYMLGIMDNIAAPMGCYVRILHEPITFEPII